MNYPNKRYLLKGGGFTGVYLIKSNWHIPLDWDIYNCGLRIGGKLYESIYVCEKLSDMAL